MVEGFDFGFTPEGEIVIDADAHDIQKSTDNDLIVQIVYNKLKSIAAGWFVDNIGADLEELIGKPCTTATAEYGKQRIMQVLTEDDLLDENDIAIQAIIRDNTNITYTIYIKMYQSETEDVYSYEITAELDLIKGVFIRYGWEPRR